MATQMQVDTPIPRLTAAEEDYIITYRLSHPSEARALAKQAAGLLSNSTEAGAQGDAQAARDGLRAEGARLGWSLKRLTRAREVQDRTVRGLRRRAAELDAAAQHEEAGLQQDEAVLADARRRAARFEACERLRAELAGKARTCSQLDGSIATLQSALEAERTKKLAFLAEATARKSAFEKVSALLTEIRGMERVDPERAVEREKEREREPRREREGHGREGKREREREERDKAGKSEGPGRLDPSAPAFRPGGASTAVPVTGTSGTDRPASSASHASRSGGGSGAGLPSRPGVTPAPLSRQPSGTHAERSAAGRGTGGMSRSSSSAGVPTTSGRGTRSTLTSTSSADTTRSTGRATRSSAAAPPPLPAPATRTRRDADAEDGEVISDTTGTPPSSAGIKRAREEEGVEKGAGGETVQDGAGRGRKRRGGSVAK